MRLELEQTVEQTNRLNGRNDGITSVLPDHHEEDEHIESVSPTLLIGPGGTGTEILRRVKARNPNGGDRCWSLLAFDTDPRSQEPQGDLPGFTSAEFCLLPTRSVRDVIRRPEYHSAMASRLGLSDVKTWQSLATIAERRIPGAGQVRPIGYLALAANHKLVQTRIHQAADALQHRWTALVGRLNTRDSHSVKFQRGLEVQIVGSNYGGSGSSWFIDIAAMIRQEFAGSDLSITAILTLPEVHEDVLQGKIEEQARIEANCIAAATELDYFQTGQAAADGLRMGQLATRAPAQLFDHVYLVGKYDSEGRSVGSMEDVFDLVALHLAGHIGTTIGGKFKAVGANDATVAGLSVCPISGRKRNYSTLSATALVVPAERLTSHLACRSVSELIQEHFLGSDSPIDHSAITEWAKAAQFDEGTEGGAECVSTRLKAAATPGLDGITAPLYADADPSRPRYLKNKLFVPALAKAQQAWKDSSLPGISQRLGEQTAALASEYCAALETKVAAMADADGLRPVASFLTVLGEMLDSASNQITEEAKQYGAQAADASAGIEQITGALIRFWSGFGRNPGAQEEVIRLFRSQVSADVDAAAKLQSAMILSAVREASNRLSARFSEAIEHLETRTARLDTEALRNSQDQKTALTTANVAPRGEIDVVSPEFLESFYAEHRLSTPEFLKGAEAAGAQPMALLDGDSASQLCNRLTAYALEHFAHQIDKLSISDVLKFQLDHGGDLARVTQARFEEALQACRPMWQAEIGVAGMTFSDSLVVGIPEGFAELAAGHLGEITRNIQANVNQDPRYLARLDFVPTCDPHRIYVLRRSHGGLPTYLTVWKKYRQSYETWMRSGAHPIHIFDPAVVDAMPPLAIPDPESDGELEFALGSAYGVIARRGSWYYLNLTKDEKTEVFELPVTSFWDCIPFQGGALRSDMGSFQHLTGHGKLTFGQAPQPDRTLKLSEQSGRPAALKEFVRSQKSVRLVREFHKALCTASGNVVVARDLESYAAEVARSLKPSDDLYNQIRRELVWIRREVENLRANR